MNRREIVIDALNHKSTRPIPYAVDLTHQARERLIAYMGNASVADNLGSFMRGVSGSGDFEDVPGKPGYVKDIFGVVWNRNGADKDIGVIDGFVIKDPENITYQFPIADIAEFRRRLQKLVASDTDEFKFANFGFSMFERAWTLMGMENVLTYMITCPESLEAFFDKICEFWIPLVDIALEYNIDGVMFGDDWGQQHGTIMGPEYWRRFIKPRMARLYQKVKAKGKYVLQHSCGDCRELFPDLIEIGLDCYQTFQPEIYDIKKIKETYGKDLSFWGAISTQQCLPKMDAKQVQQEIVRIARILSVNGGYILAPTHSIPGDVKPENILAMLEVFQNQEKFI
ncbi:MAG: uroporphyrinogen decarboxylase [Treponema sp.]|nr:uroporphyrinogen decarboxylase [Treponema sp.]